MARGYISHGSRFISTACCCSFILYLIGCPEKKMKREPQTTNSYKQRDLMKMKLQANDQITFDKNVRHTMQLTTSSDDDNAIYG